MFTSLWNPRPKPVFSWPAFASMPQIVDNRQSFRHELPGNLGCKSDRRPP
jgi:hypothetical protein